MFSNLYGSWYRENTPVRKFTSYTFDQLVVDLVDFARTRYSDLWTNFAPASFEMMFVDLVAWMGEYLLHMLDVRVRETNPYTMVDYDFFLKWARIFDFLYSGPVPARGQLTITSEPGVFLVPPFGYYLTKDHVFSADTASGIIRFHPDYADPGVWISVQDQVIDIVEGEAPAGGVESLGTSDGSANQAFELARYPVILSSLEVYVGPTLWTREDSLSNYEEDSEYYRIRVSPTGVVEILFGDGIYGAIPPLAQVLSVSYFASVGTLGNLAANTITEVDSAPQYVTAVTNTAVSNSRGTGTDGETLVEAKKRLATTLRTQERLISSYDFVTFTESYFTGAKARMFVGTTPSEPVIVVALSESSTISSLQKMNILRDLSTIKYLGVFPYFQDPVFKSIEWNINLFIRDNFRSSDVEAYTRDKIKNAAGTGWFDYTNLSFAGRDINGNLIFTLQALYKEFADLYERGVLRAVFTRFRPKVSHTFSGQNESSKPAISYSVTDDNDVGRHEWVVRVVNTGVPEEFDFYRRVVGRSTYAGTNTLTDTSKGWGPNQFNPIGLDEWYLYPNRNYNTGKYRVISWTSNTITVDPADVVTYGELQIWSSPDTEYYVEVREADGLLTDAGPFTNIEDTLQYDFDDSAATARLTVGDEFRIDTYDEVADLDLRDNELPVLNVSNDLTISPIGGIE